MQSLGAKTIVLPKNLYVILIPDEMLIQVIASLGFQIEIQIKLITQLCGVKLYKPKSSIHCIFGLNPFKLGPFKLGSITCASLFLFSMYSI